MAWEPWKDVEKAVSDVFKSGEKFVSDVWDSDAAKVIVPAVIGFVIGGPVGAAAGAKGGALAGAAIGAGYGLSSVQQKKAIESAGSLQEKQFAAQKELQRRQIEYAGQQYELTEKQMEFQMGQRQIGILTERLLEQDREPRILTLPASREPPGIVDRFNLWIDQALRA